MESLFWICFLIGVIYTIVVVIFGDLLSGFFEASLEWLHFEQIPVLQPMTLMGGLTIFGGSGLVLSKYFSFDLVLTLIIALLITIVGVVLLYFFYLKPMASAEQSTGFSLQQFVGKEAEISVPIPEQGFGEVLVRTVNGISNHIAASYDKAEISLEAKVVVVEVKEGVLYVSEIQL